MNKLISELVKYGIQRGLIDAEDKVFVINRLLEVFELNSFEWSDEEVREIHCILSDMTDYAVENGIIEEDTITNRDLFDTKVMGIITPMPSSVRLELFFQSVGDVLTPAAHVEHALSVAAAVVVRCGAGAIGGVCGGLVAVYPLYGASGQEQAQRHGHGEGQGCDFFQFIIPPVIFKNISPGRQALRTK